VSAMHVAQPPTAAPIDELCINTIRTLSIDTVQQARSVALDDIRRFRQLDGKAPGHPEYHWVSGVETTTGPLGQGVATSVGVSSE
jgi:transketolase